MDCIVVNGEKKLKKCRDLDLDWTMLMYNSSNVFHILQSFKLIDSILFEFLCKQTHPHKHTPSEYPVVAV